VAHDAVRSIADDGTLRVVWEGKAHFKQCHLRSNLGFTVGNAPEKRGMIARGGRQEAGDPARS
jgi:hypothetical protein